MCFLLKLMPQQCETQYELGQLLQLFAGAEQLFSDGKTALPGAVPELSSCILEFFLEGSQNIKVH